MEHSEFAIGETFYCGDGLWRCTDIGTRTIIAIRLDHVCTVIVIAEDGQAEVQRRTTLDQAEAEAAGWFKGPPYAVAEEVFDEYDIEGCSKDINDE